MNLNCLFAILLNTTPEETAQQLKKYGNAAKATARAREIAAGTLTGIELDSVTETLDQLDKARARRNRIQHDVWAKKGGDDIRMFAFQSNEYFAFTTNLLSVTGVEKEDGADADRSIYIAREFAVKISNGYTIEDLQDIALALDSVSKSFLQPMFSQITFHRTGQMKKSLF